MHKIIIFTLFILTTYSLSANAMDRDISCNFTVHKDGLNSKSEQFFIPEEFNEIIYKKNISIHEYQLQFWFSPIDFKYSIRLEDTIKAVDNWGYGYVKKVPINDTMRLTLNKRDSQAVLSCYLGVN